MAKIDSFSATAIWATGMTLGGKLAKAFAIKYA